jgi:hypothetical protein
MAEVLSGPISVNESKASEPSLPIELEPSHTEAS